MSKIITDCKCYKVIIIDSHNFYVWLLYYANGIVYITMITDWTSEDCLGCHGADECVS